MNRYYKLDIIFPAIISLILYLILLYKTYIQDNCETCDDISKPLAITVLTVICLIIIS